MFPVPKALSRFLAMVSQKRLSLRLFITEMFIYSVLWFHSGWLFGIMLFWICIDHAQNWGSLLLVVVQANSLIFIMMFDMLLVLWFMLKCNLLLTPKGFYNKNQSVLYQCRPHWFRPHVTLIQYITTFTRNSVFCWLEYSEKKRRKKAKWPDFLRSNVLSNVSELLKELISVEYGWRGSLRVTGTESVCCSTHSDYWDTYTSDVGFFFFLLISSSWWRADIVWQFILKTLT